MYKFGIILDGSDQHIGTWRVVDKNHLELNLEDGQVDKVIQLAETAGTASLQFMLDPDVVEL